MNNGLYIFTWSILGEETGSQGGAAAFEGRIIVMEEDGGVRVKPLDMYSGLSGKFDRCLTMDMDQALGHVYED